MFKEELKDSITHMRRTSQQFQSEDMQVEDVRSDHVVRYKEFPMDEEAKGRPTTMQDIRKDFSGKSFYESIYSDY